MRVFGNPGQVKQISIKKQNLLIYFKIRVLLHINVMNLHYRTCILKNVNFSYTRSPRTKL